MHSSLPLAQPLDVVVNTQERQSQTALVTNLTPQRWKKTAPFSLLRALLSGRPKGARKRGLPATLFSSALKSKSSSTGYSYIHGRQTAGDLKGRKFYCYFPAVEKSDTTFRESISQEKAPAGVFWWDAEKPCHPQLQKFFTKSLHQSKGKFWTFLFKQSCCFIMRDYLLQPSGLGRAPSVRVQSGRQCKRQGWISPPRPPLQLFQKNQIR